MTIDVNIPESVIDEIVERVTDSLDTTSTADLKERVDDLEDLESRLDDLERSVEDIDTKECVSQDEFNDLESRVSDLEKGDYLDRVSELEAIVARLERTLNEFIQNIRVATERIEV